MKNNSEAGILTVQAMKSVSFDNFCQWTIAEQGRMHPLQQEQEEKEADWQILPKWRFSWISSIEGKEKESDSFYTDLQRIMARWFVWKLNVI